MEQLETGAYRPMEAVHDVAPGEEYGYWLEHLNPRSAYEHQLKENLQTFGNSSVKGYSVRRGSIMISGEANGVTLTLNQPAQQAQHPVAPCTELKVPGEHQVHSTAPPVE